MPIMYPVRAPSETERRDTALPHRVRTLRRRLAVNTCFYDSLLPQCSKAKYIYTEESMQISDRRMCPSLIICTEYLELQDVILY